MSKEKRIIISIIAALFALFCFDVWVLFYREEPEDPNIKYDIYGEGAYTYFGDGRFQVRGYSHKPEVLKLVDYLNDTSQSFYLVERIKKYILSQDSLAVTGDFSAGTTDTKTGERISFNDDRLAANYLVLNIKTGESQYFVSLEEMTQEEKALFSKELDDECIKARTCYQEEEVGPSHFPF